MDNTSFWSAIPKMKNLMLSLILILGIVAVVVFVLQYMWRYVFSYKLTQTSVDILLFGRIPIMRIPFDDIVEIRTVGFPGCLWAGMTGLRNRAFGRTVLIRRRGGVFSNSVLIAPDHADEFVREVLRRRSR